jgi:hypothetical protein
MAVPVPTLTVLRRAFVDICRGYSVGKHLGRDIYVRHLSHFQHEEYDYLQSCFEDHAVEQGAPREAVQLERLKAKGLWTTTKERDIERQRDTIARFEEARKTVVLPSMQENYDKQIGEEKGKLSQLLVDRANLLGLTAEMYAQRRLNDHYILTNVFSDVAFSQPLYTPDSFDDMGDGEVEALLVSYHAAILPCDDANLRHLCVQEFFTSYYNLCGDDSSAFFGKPVCQLTYYQVRLSNIAKYFKAIMEQVDMSKVDPKTRHDPDAIEKVFISQRNMAKMSEEGKVPVGMTQSDLQKLGVKGQLTDIREEMSAAQLVERLRKGGGQG